MPEKVKWLYWLKWLLIMTATLIVSYVITVIIIFGAMFEDVEESAKLTCDQFNVGDSWEEVKSISHRNGFKPALDKKNAMVSFFFYGDFLGIAGCELFFEDNILTKKNVWVD